MAEPSLEDFASAAVEIAREAGAILRDRFGRPHDIQFKAAVDMVTEADKASEALIAERLRARFPDHDLLGEEGTRGAADIAAASPYRWVIDPLDGTTNFAHQYPAFCVSIAFEQRGEVLCGAVFDPWRDEMFSGVRGLGSFVNGERLRVSEAQTLRSALLMTGFPYNFREKIKPVMSQFEAFLIESQAVRRGGSAALDLCYTAIGRVDGFWEIELHPWDTAAGLVIAEEAGGRVTNFSGEPFTIYGKQILASNGRIHDEMVAVLRRLG